MFYRRFTSFAVAAVFALSMTVAGFAADTSDKRTSRVNAPVNLAILIQDDLTSQVANELEITRDFIRTLPAGSRVMVGYITTGSLQVRQPFTTDLDRAARSLRMPVSSTTASPYNPYVELIQALKKFDSTGGTNAVLLVSDGLDTSHGFDVSSAGHTLDLERAIKHANDRDVAVYTFYAPSVGLTGRNRLAASYGQSSLNRLAKDTGGRAFFQGTTGFVSFDSYFQNLKRALNEQSARPA